MFAASARAPFRCVLISLVLLTASFVPWRPPLRAQSQGLLVLIVSKHTPLTDVSSATLRRAFEGHPVEYASGMPLIPFNAVSGTPERDHFDRAVLGMSRDEVGRFWVDQRIRGATQPPRTLPSPEFGVRVIAALPGGISYVRESYVNETVRVVTIDGKRPEHRDYLLASP